MSDLHILDLNGVRLKRFANRRAIGAVNVFLNRAAEYRGDILECLVEDLLKEEPDHIVVSGDVSNMALESEFERIFHLLKLLGGYDRISLVPGNHDYYTDRAAETRRFEKYFFPFMFKSDFSDLDVDIYPYTKRIGDVLLVGVNSATRTVPPFSYGSVGDRQLSLLEHALSSRAAESCLTVLVLHHAMHRRDVFTETTSGLIHRERLLSVIEKQRVDLVLYGHDHVGRVWKRESEGHTTHFVCCGSSTRLNDDPDLVAKYRIITVDQGRIRRIDTKVYDPTTRKFVML